MPNSSSMSGFNPPSKAWPRQRSLWAPKRSTPMACATYSDLGEEPVAFVVVKPGMTVTPHELDSLCLDNLARFKRPRDYFFPADLPKNNYGKILKKTLRQQLKEGQA